MERKFVPPSVDVYDLIEDAVDGGILLAVLRPADTTEINGKEYYVVDSIHVADGRNGEYLCYLKKSILVPPDFNALSEREKVAYLSFFTDSVPSWVLERLTDVMEGDPESVAVVLVHPEDVGWVSEVIELRYQELEEENQKTFRYRDFYWW